MLRWFGTLTPREEAGSAWLGRRGGDARTTRGAVAVPRFAHGKPGGVFLAPLWVVMICPASMARGTLAGGWRIVRAMGSTITRLSPRQGLCAETDGAITLFRAALADRRAG